MSLNNMFFTDDRTKVIYFGVDGSVWHISGYGQGGEGAVLGVEPGGLYFPELDQIWLESARQLGGTYQGDTFPRREIDFEIQISGKTNREFMLRNRRWWEAWSTRVPGVLAMFTKTHGWRWIRVRLSGNVEPKWGKDPSLIKACDYDMTVTADDPLWRSFREKSHWINKGLSGNGVVQLENMGSMDAFPEYTMPGPGQYSIQDGPDGRMITLPPVKAGQTMRLDTHPLKLSLRVYDNQTGPDGRTAWKGLKTQRFRGSIPPGGRSRIRVSVTGGNANSQVFATLSPGHYSPF